MINLYQDYEDLEQAMNEMTGVAMMKNIDEKKQVWHLMHENEFVSEHNTKLDALQAIGWKAADVKPLLTIKPIIKHTVIKYSEVE